VAQETVLVEGVDVGERQRVEVLDHRTDRILDADSLAAEERDVGDELDGVAGFPGVDQVEQGVLGLALDRRVDDVGVLQLLEFVAGVRSAHHDLQVRQVLLPAPDVRVGPLVLPGGRVDRDHVGLEVEHRAVVVVLLAGDERVAAMAVVLEHRRQHLDAFELVAGGQDECDAGHAESRGSPSPRRASNRAPRVRTGERASIHAPPARETAAVRLEAADH
jgi:hypothetical protein